MPLIGAGPQFTYRNNSNVQPFIRMIFGAGTLWGDVTQLGSAHSTAFFLSPGGGVDLRLMKHVWARGGFDYFHADKQGVSINGFQVIAGLQFRFGKSTRADETNVQSSRPAGIAPTQQSPSEGESTPVPGTAVPVLGAVVSARQNGGCQVQQITRGGLAALAGLHSGDVDPD